MAAAGTLFGYAVRSDYDLARLSLAPPCRGELEIARSGEVLLGDAHVTHHVASSGGAVTIARSADGTVLVQCSLAGGFRVDIGARRIVADRSERDDVWEHRLVTLAVPLLMAELGDVTLHAAGIVSDGAAVVFAGPSGRGKSTLALAAAELGLGVLADDGVVVQPGHGGGRVWPGPAGVAVAGPGETRKTVRATAAGSSSPAALAAIVVLGDRLATRPAVERLAPAAAVPALVPSLIFSGSDRLARAMRDAAQLASAVPVFRCHMPDRVDRLPEALTAVLDRLTDGAA